uniref:Reverse transcriptase/endonuclease n=1 Tax=Adineta vaga TaxID=104782 RepID=C9DIN0_ADIVA|nr:reverse transcriptase/endonuclease [Adineta vaga]
MNLPIREHVVTVHNINKFNYLCQLCSKSYDTINSVKAHYVACRRQRDASSTTDVATNVTSNNQLAVNNNQVILRNPLQCIECQMKQVDFCAKDTKALVTHMRTKHAAAYEESKKVATKRVAWSPDEDQILAELEVKLKKMQKGQLLSRLVVEYNKCAVKSKAPSRSKDAIRTRRQQHEYKLLLRSLQSQQLSDDSECSDSDISSSNNNPVTTTHNVTPTPDPSDVGLLIQKIRESVDSIVKIANLKLNTNMLNAANAFINQDNGIDPLELSMRGIEEDVKAIRDKELQKPTRSAPSSTSSGKSTRNAKRLEKLKKYGYYQHLYYNNKKKLVAEILDGETSGAKPPPMNLVEDYYKNIWSRSTIDDSPVNNIKTVNSDSIFAPISRDEIKLALSNTKKDSAAGPDSVTIKEAKAIIDNLYVAYNIWLGVQGIPEQLKLNKTILIPKGNSDLSLLKNWRPITISSIILRVYNRLLAYRMNKVFKTNDKQVGFKPVNGCGINISWLHSLLKHARLNKNPIYACLVDVSKAFDSVSHQSIVRALTMNGAPSLLVKLIMDQYTNINTIITCSGSISNKINISSGVKQGDPLSSLLFNMVIDELFDVIKDQYGYTIDNIGTTNARCFADDLTLISSSRMGMNKLLELTTEFFKERGLNVNPSKCMSIGMSKGYKGKKSKIESEPLFSIADAQIPMLGYIDKTTRYLGVNFTSIGAIDAKRIKKDLHDTLDKLEHLKLKAQCKMDLLRTYMIPRFMFQLIHTELYPKLLIKMDILIRKLAKRILHLPISTSSEFFYLPFKEGGLQLTSLKEAVGLAKIKLHKKIMSSNDPMLCYLIESQRSRIIEHFMKDLKLGDSLTLNEMDNIKECFMKEKRISFAQKIHGVGFEVFSSSPLTNQWINGEIKTMTTRTYINSIKLRTNTLETRVTTSRGLNIIKTCRRCHVADESLMHVLQYCSSTKGLRYSRHHRICAKVANKLMKNGYGVYREKSYPDPNNSGSYLRPDLIAVKDGHVIVLDVTVVYEVTGATFINAYQTKVNKYNTIMVQIEQMFNCVSGVLHGLVIGSRGSIHHSQLHIWHQMGFSSTELKYVAIGCMEDSLRIMSTFSKAIL